MKCKRITDSVASGVRSSYLSVSLSSMSGDGVLFIHLDTIASTRLASLSGLPNVLLQLCATYTNTCDYLSLNQCNHEIRRKLLVNCRSHIPTKLNLYLVYEFAQQPQQQEEKEEEEEEEEEEEASTAGSIHRKRRGAQSKRPRKQEEKKQTQKVSTRWTYPVPADLVDASAASLSSPFILDRIHVCNATPHSPTRFTSLEVNSLGHWILPPRPRSIRHCGLWSSDFIPNSQCRLRSCAGLAFTQVHIHKMKMLRHVKSLKTGKYLHPHQPFWRRHIDFLYLPSEVEKLTLDPFEIERRPYWYMRSLGHLPSLHTLQLKHFLMSIFPHYQKSHIEKYPDYFDSCWYPPNLTTLICHHSPERWRTLGCIDPRILPRSLVRLELFDVNILAPAGAPGKRYPHPHEVIFGDGAHIITHSGW